MVCLVGTLTRFLVCSLERVARAWRTTLGCGCFTPWVPKGSAKQTLICQSLMTQSWQELAQPQSMGAFVQKWASYTASYFGGQHHLQPKMEFADLMRLTPTCFPRDQAGSIKISGQDMSAEYNLYWLRPHEAYSAEFADLHIKCLSQGCSFGQVMFFEAAKCVLFMMMETQGCRRFATCLFEASAKDVPAIDMIWLAQAD